MSSLNDKVEEYIKSKSTEIDWDNIEECSATAIAMEIGEKRSNVTKALNEIYRANKLIKINSTPVTFLHIKTIEDFYSVVLTKKYFDTIDEFRKVLGNKGKKNVFAQLTGYNGSLKYCIEQCKSAIVYPENGLPILLYGEPGTGKSFMARLMFEYGKQKGVIPKEGKFLTVNCAEYSNNPELLLTNLFGYKRGAFTGADEDKQGILSVADNGVLFMDEVHGLKPECQEKIFLFMDKGIYHMVGDNKTWYKSRVRLIFATTEKPNNVLLKTLLRRIPITVTLPSLEDRLSKEKKELIYNSLYLEEIKVQKIIKISRMAYQILLNHKYVGNIGELENVIKASVANSLINSNGEDNINIHTYNLPLDLMESSYTVFNNPKEDKAMLEIKSLRSSEKSDNKLFALNQFLIESLLEWNKNIITLDDFIIKSNRIFEQYIDYLYFDENKIDKFTEKLTINLLTNMVNLLNQKYCPITLSNNEVGILARVLLDYGNFSDSSESLSIKYCTEIDRMLEQLTKIYSFKSNMADELLQLLYDSNLIGDNPLSHLNIFLLLNYLKRDIIPSTIPGIIIAHGYSIASGIAEVVNQLIGQHIFDAIDMPINSDILAVAEKLTEQLKRIKNCNEIIVLVDMGSLEAINRYLEDKFKMDIGIINNVTTRMALDVSTMMVQKKNIKEILEEACINNTNKYSLIENKKKQDVILSVCETGIGTANKIVDLIKKSLPSEIDTIIITYDFSNLETMGDKSTLFDKYNVLFIVGTENPDITNVPFLSIEELIEAQDITKIYSLFQGKLSYNQVICFSKNIIKNFSLENLIGYLNIVDPRKIIKSVEEVISSLQKELNMEFSSGTTLGIYIHICCLIERTIIDKEPASYNNLDDFINNHKDFIRLAKKIFLEIELSYNVTIPESEIAYLFDYIYSEKRPDMSKLKSNYNNDLFEFNE